MNSRGWIDEHQAQMPLFHGFSKHQLRTVASFGSEIFGKRGMVLTREGQPGSEFFMVYGGTVEVRAGGRVVATRGMGDYLGEIALLGARVRTATAVATTPLVVKVLSRREFSSLLGELPGLTDRLHAGIDERLSELHTLATDSATRTLVGAARVG